jgi:hypothetical protein
LEEALSPSGYDLTRHRQLLADLFVFKPFGGKEDNLGPHDLEIR